MTFSLQAAILLQGIGSWVAGNWVVLLSLLLMIGFLYFFAALFLDLPLPFSPAKGSEEADSR